MAAFDVAAMDYLLKPVEAERLERAIARIRAQIGTAPPHPATPSPWTREFWVPHRAGIIRIAARDIDLIEAERDYMRLHVGPRSFLLHKTITELERKLDPAEFVRLHRSTLVRRDRIAGLQAQWLGHLGSAAAETDAGCASAAPILPTPAPWPLLRTRDLRPRRLPDGRAVVGIGGDLAIAQRGGDHCIELGCGIGTGRFAAIRVILGFPCGAWMRAADPLYGVVDAQPEHGAARLRRQVRSLDRIATLCVCVVPATAGIAVSIRIVESKALERAWRSNMVFLPQMTER